MSVSHLPWGWALVPLWLGCPGGLCLPKLLIPVSFLLESARWPFGSGSLQGLRAAHQPSFTTLLPVPPLLALMLHFSSAGSWQGVVGFGISVTH